MNTGIKQLLLLFLLTGCASANLPPAALSPELMEQADRVVLITDSDPDELYLRVGQYLTDAGFVIENSDPALMTMQTQSRTYQEGLVLYNLSVSVSVRDSTIHLYGQSGNPLLGQWEVTYGGMRGSAARRSWDKLHETAEGYPHSQLLYRRN